MARCGAMRQARAPGGGDHDPACAHATGRERALMPGAEILGIGMITAVGTSAAQTASSVRAGVARLAESSVYNQRFAPMTLAMLPEDVLPPLVESLQEVRTLTPRQSRMLRL